MKSDKRKKTPVEQRGKKGEPCPICPVSGASGSSGLLQGIAHFFYIY
jgi:hypothetical protein